MARRKKRTLRIGEWTPVEEDDTFMIRLSKESYYSSKNQDTIILLSEIIKLRLTFHLDKRFNDFIIR